MDSNLIPGNFNLPEDENIDIKRYISLFISNWYWFAATLFIALTISYAINRYSEKIYTVSSTLLIKDDQLIGGNNIVGNVIPGGDIFRSQQNLKNEMGILRSFMLNYNVMKELKDFQVDYSGVGRRGIVETKMYKSCPFKVIYDSQVQQPYNKVGIKILSDTTYRIDIDGDLNLKNPMKFGERFIARGFNFRIEPRFAGVKLLGYNSSEDYFFNFTNPEILANEYRSKLAVGPIEKDASLVYLSVSGVVPEQAVDYLNKLMEIYVDYGREYKSKTASKTLEFIDNQLKIISDSLKRAENAIESFKKKNSFIDIGREGSLIQNKLQNLDNEKSTFDLQLNYYHYLLEYLNLKNVNDTIISPSLMGITDGVLLRLVGELSQIQKEREKLGFNFENNQANIGFINEQEIKLRESLRENVLNNIGSIKSSIGEIEKKVDSVDVQIKILPSREIKFIQVQREFDINNTVYTYLLEKRAETGIARASIVSDNRIIDYASTSNSSLIKPRAKRNIMLAIILGLVFPMILIALIDFFNDKVIDKRDIEKKTKVPIIGYISHNDGKNEMPVVEKPGSSLAESFRSIRTSLKYFMSENDKPVIVVSSTISSEGKTFIAINLAAITALLGKRVLLIGLDLRKPRINKVFEFDESPGMSAYLSGNCGYDDIIRKTQIKNLFYAPSGPIPPNPAELIDTDQMRIFMAKAKKEFDFIIIDTPPVAIVTDTLLLAPYVDINLFIVRQRYTSRNTLEMVEQLKNQGKLKNLAIVINDINISGYYGYGMRYGYSLGYGYSYGYNYYGKGYYGKYGYSNKSSGYYVDGD
jgi:capsular exopolysaccharide synthesis family protein